MIVLVDTSVWVEYYRRNAPLDTGKIDFLIEERRVATCRPIRTEVLSGEMTDRTRKTISEAFDAMPHLDPDWNSLEIWEEISGLAIEARSQGLGVPGLVDRMILLSTRQSSAELWTLDKRLRKLSQALGIPLFS